MNDAELAEVVGDPRLPPRWHFVVIGGLVALGLMLVRVHVLFVLVPGLGLGVLGLLAHRRGAYRVEERARSAIALHAPLPGTMAPTMAAIVVLLTSAYVIAGLFVPSGALPPWGAATLACAVGIAAALLLRRSEVMRVAGTRRLELRANGAGSADDGGASDAAGAQQSPS